MVPSLDIFRLESGGVLWCGAAETVESAKDRIKQLAHSSPGSYVIFNQTTGGRIVVTLAPLHKLKHPSVESAHHGPRVGVG
jgi:hypothetical protein